MKVKKSAALSRPPTRLTRAQAIRAKCKDCCCDVLAEIKACEIKNCPLWIYRMGYEVDLDGKRVTRDKEE